MMRAELWGDDGDFLEWIEVPSRPICGLDFCAACSECLSCECDHLCAHSDDGEHPWAAMENELETFLAAHPGAAMHLGAQEARR